MFNFTFDIISRQEYDTYHGCDAEESVSVFFNATVKQEEYKASGWKDKRVMIQLVEKDRYTDYPHFTAHYKEEGDKTWKYHYLSNHIEAVEFLQKIELL